MGWNIEGSKKGGRLKLWIILLVTAILICLPTSHVRTRLETVGKSDLLHHLDCSLTLEGGRYIPWHLTDLPDKVRVVVKISSTDDVNVYIKTKSGVVCDKTMKVHDYTLYADGPSMEVKVTNPPGIFLNPPAVMSGGIEIYHDYQVQVEVVYKVEWMPWWMP